MKNKPEKQIGSETGSKTPVLSKTGTFKIFGVMLGLLFPISAIIIECWSDIGSLIVVDILQAHKANPLLWIIDITPLFIGLLVHIWNIKQDKIEKYAKSLKDMLESRTAELSATKKRLESVINTMGDMIDDRTAELSATKRHLVDIINSAGDMVISMDNDGIIKEINTSTLAIMGYEESELLGHSVSEIFGEYSLDKIRLKNGNDLFEFGFFKTLDGEYQTKYGHFVYLRISVSYLWDESGNQQGIICVGKDITDIKESESRFSSIFKSASDAIICTDGIGTINMWNSAATKLFGYSEEEAIGQGVIQLMPDRFKETHVNGYMDFLNTGKRSITQSVEVFGVHKDGSEFNIELTLTDWKVKNNLHFTAIIRDITARKKMEEALHQSKERYKTLINHAPVPLLVSQEEKFVFLNSEAEKLYGYKADELKSQSIIDYVLEDDKELVYKEHKFQIKGEFVPNFYQFRIVNRAGQIRWVEITAIPFDWNDKPAILSFQSDITDILASEEKIKNQQLKLKTAYQQMTSELEQARFAQLALLPKKLPELPNVKLATRYNPMAQIGGDFYDLFINGREELGIMVGDVTGHGIPAALLSFLFLATFKNTRNDDPVPDVFMKQANAFLAGKLPKGKYASMYFCLYDAKNQILHYTSAGHPPAFLIRLGAEQLIPLQTRGMVVGMFENPMLPYESKSIELRQGDKVLIYTDGIMEITDDSNQMLDEKKLEEFLISQMCQPIDQLLDLVYDFCSEYSGHRGFDDDVTMIGMEIL